MDTATPDFRLLQFSSNLPPPTERFELWRDIIARKLPTLVVDPSANDRTRSLAEAHNDDVVFMANLSGLFIVRQDDDDVDLQPGDAVLVSCDELASFMPPSAGRLLCIRLPRAVLRLFVPKLEACMGRRIPADNGALQLLIAYVSPIASADDLSFSPEASRAVVNHACDLVALAVGASGDSARLGASRGLRAARLNAVRACIDAQVNSEHLSVEDVAAAVGVSSRYVRKLLESAGISFSRYVMARRLDRARDLLMSPHHAGQSISTIAYDVGFSDLSYFNRSFRRRFEHTPSDVRSGRL
jgi:AraC-like DNA-binding protein